jgi:predicted O-methyltransferase YrrM
MESYSALVARACLDSIRDFSHSSTAFSPGKVMVMTSSDPIRKKILRRVVHYIHTMAARADRLQIQVLSDVPFPLVDITTSNPIPVILDAPEFELVDRFFCQSPAIERSLVSARSQALIYCLIRNLRPENVFEIGTYRAGTAEAICRGLYANASGTLHTVDPFSEWIIKRTLSQWPPELRRHVRFYALDSMAFFANKLRVPTEQPSFVFVDGNHDYEYAFFDIHSAARVLMPGGFIVIDNIAQPGPFLAARDFLEHNLGWRECGYANSRFDAAKPFDRERCDLPGTELMILRAPSGPVVGTRPIGFPEVVLLGRTVRGVEVVPAAGASSGILNVQCIARGFSHDKKTVETANVGKVAIDGGVQGKTVKIEFPADLDATDFEHIRAEIWLSWTGAQPLTLSRRPAVF